MLCTYSLSLSLLSRAQQPKERARDRPIRGRTGTVGLERDDFSTSISSQFETPVVPPFYTHARNNATTVRFDWNWMRRMHQLALMMRMRPHKFLLVHLMGLKMMAQTWKTIVLIHESKYCIIHENLYSRICINIGASHFGNSFVSLACPLFRHDLELLNFRTCQTSLYFGVNFLNPLCTQRPFL